MEKILNSVNISSDDNLEIMELENRLELLAFSVPGFGENTCPRDGCGCDDHEECDDKGGCDDTGSPPPCSGDCDSFHGCDVFRCPKDGQW